MDPAASLPRVERHLLRISKERGFLPFVVSVTAISIALSVAISVLAMILTGADRVEMIFTILIATLVPGIVAPTMASVVGRLLHALDQASTELRHLSRTDALTGALNRRAFADDAADLLRSGESASFLVAMIDVDDFKGVNDRHGHPAGDLVLSHLAHSLALAAPRGLVGRFGGDEFVVVQPVAPGEAAAARQALRAACDLGAVIPGVSASFGSVVIEPSSEIGLAEAMTRADHALYSAKRDREPTAPGVTARH